PGDSAAAAPAAYEAARRFTTAPARTGARRGVPAPPARLLVRSGSRRDDVPDRPHQVRLRDRADDLLFDLPAAEEDQVRDAADAVARRRAGVLVDVHLHDL